VTDASETKHQTPAALPIFVTAVIIAMRVLQGRSGTLKTVSVRHVQSVQVTANRSGLVMPRVMHCA